MDPDETLRIVRSAAAQIQSDPNASTAAGRLAEAVMALDMWITAGGFLPRAWSLALGIALGARPEPYTRPDLIGGPQR